MAGAPRPITRSCGSTRSRPRAQKSSSKHCLEAPLSSSRSSGCSSRGLKATRSSSRRAFGRCSRLRSSSASEARLAEHVERLGHHALRGEVWERAVKYLRQAGAKAFDWSANREAAASFERALGALQRLPERRDTIEQSIDVRLDLRNALWGLGES